MMNCVMKIPKEVCKSENKINDWPFVINQVAVRDFAVDKSVAHGHEPVKVRIGIKKINRRIKAKKEKENYGN